MADNKKGKIIAVSAPSGAGKTTIIKVIRKIFPELVFSVSATTRQKRDNEIYGADYFFISEEEFKQRIENNEFVEWEKFYDYYYGTFKSFIDDNVNYGKSVIVEIDVNGALSLKKIYPEAALIYILPPTYQDLEKRLILRNTESEADLAKRIERAKMELSLKDKFDYFVVNEDLNKAISEVQSLVERILYSKE